MVAYSFVERFERLILMGLKLQTIRGNSGKRHARPGETMQLYINQRRPDARLILTPICRSVWPIRLLLGERHAAVVRGEDYAGGLDQLARDDGFGSWSEMRVFWDVHHPGVVDFSGVLIRWWPPQ